MALYYVPAVLVINTEEYADSVAENILDALCNLNIEKLDGYTLMAELSSSEASTKWANKAQALRNQNGKFVVVEEEM